MYKIEQIADYPYQTKTLTIFNGKSVQLTMRYAPLQLGWFADIVYGDFVLNGIRITNQPNMLRQFMNLIPFGLACYSKEDREPQFQNDFSSGASSIFIMDTDEVQEFEDYLSGQV